MCENRLGPSHIEPIPGIERCATSDIVLDGGNLVGCGSWCVMTAKVFPENPGLDQDVLVERLQDLLRVEQLVVIPREPYDRIGHADGVLRFLDSRNVVINDYSEVVPAYRDRILGRLRGSGLGWVEVPYRPEGGCRGGIPSAFGNYVNYLRVQGLVVLPSYRLPEDELARKIIADLLPATDVRTRDCLELSREGGVLNCATRTVVA